MAHHRIETIRANRRLPSVEPAPETMYRNFPHYNPPLEFEPSLNAVLRHRPPFPQPNVLTEELRERPFVREPAHRLTNRTEEVSHQVLI